MPFHCLILNFIFILILSPDPLYVRAGPAVPQWSLSGLASLYNTGVFLLPNSQFTSEARVLALEIYGHTAGDIKVFVSNFQLFITKETFHYLEVVRCRPSPLFFGK